MFCTVGTGPIPNENLVLWISRLLLQDSSDSDEMALINPFNGCSLGLPPSLISEWKQIIGASPSKPHADRDNGPVYRTMACISMSVSFTPHLSHLGSLDLCMP